MTLIIDGYNVLHTAKIFNSHITREKLINLIVKYALIKKHTITLVFDGGDSFYAQEIQHNGISIIFSGYGQTADDAIIALLKTQKNRAEKVLISTDRALIEKAHDYNIISIDSEIFYPIMSQSISKSEIKIKKKHEQIIKYNHDSNEELDELILQGEINKKEEYSEARTIKKQSHTLSLEEKKIAEILKKL